jgi:hypothetical protein
VFDIQRRERVWKALKTEIAIIPARHEHAGREPIGSTAARQKSGEPRDINALLLVGAEMLHRINSLLSVTFCTAMTRTPCWSHRVSPGRSATTRRCRACGRRRSVLLAGRADAAPHRDVVPL